MPSPGETPQGGLSCPFGAIHLRVARRAGRLRPQARAASNRRRRLLASVGIREEIYKSKQHNRPPPKLPLRQHPGGGLHISEIITLPPAFLISHQSVPKSRLATARNCGVIAPGNHWIYDSLRGAPPPGEAIGAYAPKGFLNPSGPSNPGQEPASPPGRP